MAIVYSGKKPLKTSNVRRWDPTAPKPMKPRPRSPYAKQTSRVMSAEQKSGLYKRLEPSTPQWKAFGFFTPNPGSDSLMDKFVGQLKKEVANIPEGAHKVGKTIASFGRKMYTPFRPVVSVAKTAALGGVQTSMVTTRAGNVLSVASRKGNPLLRGAKAARRMVKSFPKPIRKAGLVAGIAAGAAGMLSLSVLKGAMDSSREIVYERYMNDMAVTKNVLNNTRMGLTAGTSRMQNMGSTMGLSNSLSRTRHG